MMMKFTLPAIIALGLVVAGCQSTPKQQVQQVVKQEVKGLGISQQVIDELKKGLPIYFDKNSTEIAPKYKLHLTAAAQLLSAYPQYKLVVEGHTDTSGNPQLNQRVSTSRAEMVRSTLVTQYGVSPSQIEAIGRGQTQPIASNANEEGRQLNRRVSLTLKTN